jgi:hypothetical protein
MAGTEKQQGDDHQQQEARNILSHYLHPDLKNTIHEADSDCI